MTPTDFEHVNKMVQTHLPASVRDIIHYDEMVDTFAAQTRMPVERQIISEKELVERNGNLCNLRQ